MKLPNTNRLAPLFVGHRDIRVVIDSVLEGRVGSVMMDEPSSPTVARLRIGCYDIFGGDPDAPEARDWIAAVPTPRELVFSDPEYQRWSTLAAEVLGDRVRPCPMNTFDPGKLDPHHLRTLVEKVPEGFEIERMDPTHAAKLGDELHPHALQVYSNVETFIADGFGFAARQGDALACAATSYAICSHGVEVAIATHPRFRGRGLAASVSAAFMLHALERGLVPQWSASNPVSKRIAARLGYLPDRICPLLCVH